MTPGLISVIIPCYNVGPFVKRCVDSVLNNTYRNLQVICINDGSTDNTLEILESYTDERLEIHSHENKGLSLTRNAGYEKAKGEYVCFIDSDDWIHREFFERLVEVQRKSDVDIVICKYKKISEFCEDSDVSEVNFTTTKFLSVHDDSMLYNAAWNKLYKTEVLSQTKFLPVFAEDNLFNSTLFITNKNLACAIVDAELYYYFQRVGSLMYEFHEDKILALARGFYDISEQTDDVELKNKFITRGFKLAMSSRYKTMFRKNLDSYRKSCDVFLKNTLGKMSEIPFSTRCVYFLFTYFPPLYRLYRKKMDPTMKDWEKREIALQKKN